MSILTNLLKEIFLDKNRRDISLQKSVHVSLAQLLELGDAKISSGDLIGAEKLYIDALAQFSEEAETRDLLTEIEYVRSFAAVQQRLPGPPYYDWLNWFHATLKPGSYLEIGVETGQTLEFARSPTHAVGIDPALQITHPHETWAKLYRLKSDDFFAVHDLQQVLDGRTVDLAFIDGLHTFDQALKDFMNIERYSDSGTVVLFHDIFPVIPKTAERDRSTRFWIGDTWKVMPILMRHRPDLKIFTIPTFPSGLGVVTGLNPASSTLRRDFENICSQAMKFELEEFQPKIDDHLKLVKNDFEAVSRLILPGA